MDIAKIALAAMGSCTVIGLVVGFQETRAAGWKAFWYSLPLAGSLAALQVVESRQVVWVVLAGSALTVLVHRLHR